MFVSLRAVSSNVLCNFNYGYTYVGVMIKSKETHPIVTILLENCGVGILSVMKRFLYSGPIRT